MIAIPKPVHVVPDHEFDHLREDATMSPIVLGKKGVRYPETSGESEPGARRQADPAWNSIFTIT